MIFPKRQDFTPTKNGALGAVLEFEITREFHVESFCIQADWTPTAGMATGNADAQGAIIKRIQVIIADGARTRNVVDISGPGLLEYNQNIGLADQELATNFVPQTASGALASVTLKHLNYWVFFSHPQICDPMGSAFLLPAPRFNSNIIVRVTLASQVDMDTNGAPTYAVAAGVNVRVITNRRQVNVDKWTTFDIELAEQSVAIPATLPASLFELQIPGSYTGILLRSFQTSSIRQNIFLVGAASGEIRLQVLGTVLRRTTLADLLRENQLSLSAAATLNAGNPGDLFPLATAFTAQAYAGYFDFLTDKVGIEAGELGSVLDVNVLAATGAKAQLLTDVTNTAATTKFNVVTHRIFGDLSGLKLGR